MKPPFVYALVDPLEPQRYRYIGMTMCNARRPYVHAGRKRSLDVTQWVLSLIAEGRAHAVTILEEFPGDTLASEVYAAERRYIKDAVLSGHLLTNGNIGGNGGRRHSVATRIKMSAGRKGKKFSAAARANMSAAKRRRPPESIELCQQKRERALKHFAEHPVSDVTKEKHRVNALGNKYALGGKSILGQKHTPVARVKMQIAWTPERRAAQAERNREMARRPLEERIRCAQAALDRDRLLLAKAEKLGIA